MNKPFTIGTRGSPLAVRQAEILANALEDLYQENFGNFKPTIQTISTMGDQKLDSSLMEIGGKGLFTKEVDLAVLEGRVDCAIHSMKDLETKIDDRLIISAVLQREDVRDCLISPLHSSLATIPNGAKFGTASLRRAAQIKLYRPDLDIVLIRGNIQTRIRKLNEGLAEASMLALAGLNRMGLTNLAKQIYEPDIIIPAVAQGALAVVSRKDDTRVAKILEKLNHQPTAIATSCERVFLAQCDGSCRTPVAAFAQIQGDNLVLSGFLSNGDMSKSAKGVLSKPMNQWQELGCELADKLKSELK